jgi:N-methylhydantoinase A/oxoprolinase/acetone carboxylase beta subunit
MNYIVAVDSGITFTGCVFPGNHALSQVKSRLTPGNFSDGAVETLNQLATDSGVSLDDWPAGAAFLSQHATVATHAFITGVRAETRLIITKGAKENLLIGRGAFQKTAGSTESAIGSVVLSGRDNVPTESWWNENG